MWLRDSPLELVKVWCPHDEACYKVYLAESRQNAYCCQSTGSLAVETIGSGRSSVHVIVPNIRFRGGMKQNSEYVPPLSCNSIKESINKSPFRFFFNSTASYHFPPRDISAHPDRILTGLTAT